MKTCTKCGVQKPLEGFYKNLAKKDGLQHSCKECERKYKRLYIKNNPIKYSEQRRKDRLKHIDRSRKWFREYTRKRRREDPSFRITENCRRRINHALKGNNKSTSTQKLIGCTWKYLKQWLESQMTDTMTFDTIHIDHLMPLASFDMTKPEEQRKACHYTNLQPMLPSKNISKSSKITYDMRWNGQQWEINRSGVYELRDKNLK
jgi:ribosomal protein L16 Arg81 hydroxylase